MKLVKIGAVAAIAMVASVQAQAQDFYASVGAGVYMPEKLETDLGGTTGKIKFDTGYSLTTALGYKFGSVLRTELELALSDTGFKSASSGTTTVNIGGADIDQLGLHAAGYYDFAVGGFAPYIGVGLGITRTDLDAMTIGTTTEPGDRATDFSTFGEAGVTIPVTDRLAIVPGVRYSWIDTSGENVTAWTFKTALRYSF